MVSSQESGEKYKNTEVSGGRMSSAEVNTQLMNLIAIRHALEQESAIGDEGALRYLNHVDQEIRSMRSTLKSVA